MSKYKFTLTKEEVMAYGVKNGYAQMMFDGAANNYVSSRCLILNGFLLEGFPLYAQSIEKFLKAFIFLETGETTKLKNNDKHNPYLLKEELKIAKDYGFDQYDGLLRRLHGHFQQRYFDNKDKSKILASTELKEFDELWIYLLKLIPFPIEVKYRLAFFPEIFSETSVKFWPLYKVWATKENEFLSKELPQMEKEYFAIENHLYPSLKKFFKY